MYFVSSVATLNSKKDMIKVDFKTHIIKPIHFIGLLRIAQGFHTKTKC